MARMKALADAGHTDAALMYGELLYFGAASPRDPKLACSYFDKASKDRLEGLQNAAHCHEQGGGDSLDLVKARALYERAASGGYTQSKCALGVLLMDGAGGPADPDRAVKLCTEAADAGDANAQTDLANFYLQAKGVAKDMVKARQLYEKAAAKGQPNAAFLLGQIYWNGDGTPKDNAATAKWWRVAYDGGRVEAAQLLGNEAMVRVTAQRVAPDFDKAAAREALAWYEKALAANPPPAERARIVEGVKLLRSIPGVAEN